MDRCRSLIPWGFLSIIFLLLLQQPTVGSSVLRGNDLVKQYFKPQQNVNFEQCFSEIREKLFANRGGEEEDSSLSGKCNDFIPNVIYIESILSENDMLLLNIFHHCYRYVENIHSGTNDTSSNLVIDNEVFIRTLPDVHSRIINATIKITESYGWRPYPGHLLSSSMYINTNNNKNIRNDKSIYKLLISISPLTTYVGGSTYHIKYIDLYKNGGIPLVSTCPLEYNGGLLLQSNVDYYHDAIEHGEKNVLVIDFLPLFLTLPSAAQLVKFIEVQPYHKRESKPKAESKTSALDREIESLIANRKAKQDAKRRKLRNSLWFLLSGILLGVSLPMVFQYRYFS